MIIWGSAKPACSCVTVLITNWLFSWNSTECIAKKMAIFTNFCFPNDKSTYVNAILEKQNVLKIEVFSVLQLFYLPYWVYFE